MYISSKEIWPDQDADGLRDYVRAQWPQLADALDAECRRPEPKLPTVESGHYSYSDTPGFVRYQLPDGPWHVFGREDLVVPGTVVEVYNYTNKDFTHVEILDIVAERFVLKHSGARMRYVVAAFGRVRREKE